MAPGFLKLLRPGDIVLFVEAGFDRAVDIDDIADLISYLLSISDRDINTYKADRDENGTIDVDDVAAIIDEILSVE